MFVASVSASGGRCAAWIDAHVLKDVTVYEKPLKRCTCYNHAYGCGGHGHSIGESRAWSHDDDVTFSLLVLLLSLAITSLIYMETLQSSISLNDRVP
jgi:hypothetical protein